MSFYKKTQILRIIETPASRIDNGSDGGVGDEGDGEEEDNEHQLKFATDIRYLANSKTSRQKLPKFAICCQKFP